MDKKYILTIDQSTSGTKAILVNQSGSIIAKASNLHQQLYPYPGWVEHDPMEIYDHVKQAILQVLQSAGIEPGELAALTITNQRETAVLWDRTTGLPVYPAIVWQCQRTADICAAYKSDGHEQTVRGKTGLLLDPYFSAAKWQWILENSAEAGNKLKEGKLLAGTVDSWLLWKLTGGEAHATDYTNASRTSLYNIHTLAWDKELCSLFRVPMELLPEVKSSDDLFGYTAAPDLFEERVRITGIIGDSQAALYGNQCFRTGMAKATYGTGTSVLMNVGSKPVSSDNGLVSAIAWGIDGQITYAVEAVIRTSGDSIKWVRDNLGLFDTFEEMEALLARTEDTEGVYLIPAFVGLGAPYWEPYARAAIIGMNRGTHKGHIIRAALESIAYQVRDAVELMQAETGIPLKELRADGGASDNAALMQFQADLLDRVVVKPDVAELSAMGSVYMGGLGIGWWPSPHDIAALQMPGRIYEPSMAQEKRERHYAGWKHSIAALLNGNNKLTQQKQSK